MKKIRNALLLFLITACTIAYAQNPSLKVFEDWRTDAGSQNTFYKCDTKTIPGTTNSVVCGATLNGNGNYDLFVEQLDGAGGAVWTYQYDGTGQGDDIATAIDVDGSGNVYVTGTYYENSSDSFNVVTLMLDNMGSLQWLTKYNGAASGVDASSCIFYDASAPGIFVGGTEWNGVDYDFMVMMFSTSGSQNWSSLYDFSAGDDGVGMITVNSKGAGIAGGAYQTGTADFKYAVMNFDMSGSFSTLTTGGGTTWGMNRLTDLALDDTGNVYVTGFVSNGVTGYDARTMKLDTLLQIVWSNDYDAGYNLDDEGTGIALDSLNNVIVVGTSKTASNGLDYTVIKYDNSGGVWWQQQINGSANGDDSAAAVVVSPHDTDAIYVTGYSYNGSTKDYWTMRIDGQGNRVWDIEMNSILNGDDKATAIALDTLGDVIVSGSNMLEDSVFAYTTVKYIQKKVLMPMDTIGATSSSFVFTENNGQLFGADTLQQPEVKFYTIYGRPRVYFMDTAVSYVFVKLDSATSNDSLARVDMKFKNANPDLRIRSLDQRQDVNNFYNARIPGGREQVRNYDQLVSFNVWNNVDMIYGSNLAGLKYYFVCKPGGGGNPAMQIDLVYEGADSVKIDGSGQLIIYTKLGNIIQPKPSAWQLDASGNFSPLGWQPSYTLLGTNEVGFSGFGSFNTAYPLVLGVDWGHIFPSVILNLDWSTYYGGSAMDQLNDIDVNQSNGSSYYAGWTVSTNFPTVVGAFQWANSGGWDAVAIRCFSNGNRKYATYYGTGTFNSSFSGQWGETGAVDTAGNFFLGGRTAYAILNITFPIQPPGSYMDTTFNGGPQDAFIAAFDSVGQLFWSTYYGGSGTSVFEGIYDMTFDANGNLYCAMTCDTLTPCFFEPGAYNDTADRGGMILKFDPNYDLVWATRFGTGNAGLTSRLAFDAMGNLYATGIATDSFLPLKNPGGTTYMDSTLGGTQDAFLARFDAADSLTWCTYFGGDSGAEVGNGIEIILNEIYLFGSSSSVDYPYYYAGPGTYIDSTFNGVKDLFICEFKASGQQFWSTLYGGTGSDSPGNIDADISGNIYCTGVSSSSNFPQVNPSGIYFDGTYAGGSDAVLFSFNTQKQLTWSTYFGGTSGEYVNEGLDIYGDSCLYICGWTTTSSSAASPFPTQFLSGAYWQGTLNGTQSDGFISRFTLTPLILLGANEFIDTTESSSNMVVYPNPGNGEFQVAINSTSNNRKIEVYDLLGQLITTMRVPDGEPSQTVSLNLSEQATGIYFIVLQDDTGTYSRKVIKQ